MIKAIEPVTLNQKRDVTPIYQSVLDPDFKTENWGRPIRLEPSEQVELDLKVHIVYSLPHDEIARRLVEAVRDIVAELENAPKSLESEP
jgi:uncharacterized alkaline shock family protein YloU